LKILSFFFIISIHHVDRPEFMDGIKNFEILYIMEEINYAKYNNENPVCIRVICKKKESPL